MPILPPSLDDRGYHDLVAELVARIPAHTPEWTNPVPGDPGVTLVELFAWLADTLLYRANLIPERQRLAFLRLLGVPLRAAAAARGLVTVRHDDDRATAAVTLAVGAGVRGQGPAVFETGEELTVFPVTAECWVKRPLSDAEARRLAPVVSGLREVYALDGAARAYVTTPVFAGGAPEPDGVDLVRDTVDGMLWMALLAASPERVAEARRALGGTGPTGAPRTLSVGVAPRIAVPALLEELGHRARLPHAWELSAVDPDGEPRYFPLDVLADRDTTHGLTREGVVRLVLPVLGPGDDRADRTRRATAPTNDVRDMLHAGVGDRPPRLDDPDVAARLVCWLRLRPEGRPHELALSWVGLHAVEVDGRATIRDRIVGTGDGAPDQLVALPARAVDAASLVVQVEEADRGWVTWTRVDDVALAGRDDAAYELDAEAGTLRFGDGVRGRIPEAGRRIRVARMRAGGGRAGNLAGGSLARLDAPRAPDGTLVTAKLAVSQPLPTAGGEDAETLAEAERRIPALFRDRDRAVTAQDYRRLAADTPGLRVGRVEVLPRFKPQQRRGGVPGVVTVMTLPARDGTQPPAPRPDRPFLESVYAWLEPRRPLATELYVVACEYVPLGVGVAVRVREGAAREATLQAVRDALRALLWPLAPGGHDGAGWALGRDVTDGELAVAVARVPGVAEVRGLSLFRRQSEAWTLVPPAAACGGATLALEPWQLPELLDVIVAEGDADPTELLGALPAPPAAAIAVPVVPELC